MRTLLTALSLVGVAVIAVLALRTLPGTEPGVPGPVNHGSESAPDRDPRPFQTPVGEGGGARVAASGTPDLVEGVVDPGRDRPPAAELHPLACRVVREDGSAVTDARFEVWGGTRGRAPEPPTARDANGNYEVLLPEGTWFLAPMVEHPLLLPDTTAIDEPVTIPYIGRPPVFVLHAPAGLDGVVLDGDGNPVAEAEVLASLPALSDANQRATTDEEGRFVFEKLPAGPVALAARWRDLQVAEVVHLRSGQPTTATLRLPPGGWIVAHAFDESGEPLEEVALILFQDARQLSQGDAPGEPIGPLSPGEYTVLAVFPGNGSGDRVFSRPAIVEAGRTTEVRLEPDAAAVVIEGVVTIGEKAWGEKILFVFLEGAGLVESVRMLRTDEAGRYRLELPNPDPVVFAIDLGPRIRVVSHLAPPASAEVRHDIRITQASLHGRVEGASDGLPWAVHLQAEPRAVELPVPHQNDFVETDDDGAFELVGLRPGTYRVWAWREDVLLAGPTEVELADGDEERDVVLRRRGAGAVRGTVVDAEGNPAPNAVVHVRPADGRPYPILARSDVSGRFHVPVVPEGGVYVFAQSATGYAARDGRVEARKELTVELELRPGARILVRARTSSGGRCAAGLRAFGPDGTEVTGFGGPGGSADSFSATVSSSERTFGPLPAGVYEVVAETPDGYVARRTVHLAASDVTVELER